MTTATPARKAAAAERSRRVFLNGLGVDIAIAVATLLVVTITDLDLTDPAALITLGVNLAKTIVMAAAAYVLRLKKPPSTELAVENAAEVRAVADGTATNLGPSRRLGA